MSEHKEASKFLKEADAQMPPNAQIQEGLSSLGRGKVQSTVVSHMSTLVVAK